VPGGAALTPGGFGGGGFGGAGAGTDPLAAGTPGSDLDEYAADGHIH